MLRDSSAFIRGSPIPRNSAPPAFNEKVATASVMREIPERGRTSNGGTACSSRGSTT